MANATTEPRIGRVDEDEERQEQHDDDGLVDRGHGVAATRETMSKRVSRLAVEGGGGAGNDDKAGRDQGVVNNTGRAGGGAGRALPPPHAWLAIDDTRTKRYDSDPEEQWTRLLLRGGGGGDAGSRQHHRHQHHQQRRSSFSVVRRERAAREAWLDRAWEMKRSWHQRNGGAPDAGTPVVVVVGKAANADGAASPGHHHHHQDAGAVGGGGVAMDVEEVRACRDLGLELPSDCTVEIQCYGLSGGSSPSHTAGASSGADSPCGVISSPGADPMDVKARLKVWAQAVALASTTHLGS